MADDESPTHYPMPPEPCGAKTPEWQRNETTGRLSVGRCVYLPHEPGTPHSWQ